MVQDSDLTQVVTLKDEFVSAQTILSAASAITTGNSYQVSKYVALAFQASFGISANHMTIDGSVDNTNWVALTSAASAISSAIVTMTAFPAYIRANVRAYSSNNTWVKMNAFTT